MELNSLQEVARLHSKLSTSSKLRRWSRKPLAMALIGALSMTATANAGLPPDLGVFDQAEELPDAALGHMRGKFVSSGQVMYFGVEMVTRWQTAAGEVIRAGAEFGVNFAGHTPRVEFRPTITAEHNGTPSLQTAQGNSMASGAGGLDNVSGVVQNIQVAGTSNGVGNTIGMNVEMLSSPSTAPASAPAANGPETQSVQTASGTTATVSMAGNGIGVAVTVPDQGRAVQQIRNVAQGGGQVLQSVQLGGNLNQIHNLINLNVKMDATNGLSSHSAQVLSGLRMLPQSGTF